jgi:hypothetical protein
MTLWTPANLSTPARYIFDPSTFTYSGSNFASGSNQGSVGGAWTAESGTAVKGTPLNSRTVLALNGSQGFLNNTAAWPNGANVYVFAVGSFPNRGGFGLASHSWGSGEGADWVFYPRAGNNFGGSADQAWLFNNGAAFRTLGDLFTDSSYHIACIKLGTSADLRVDGSAGAPVTVLGSILNSSTNNFRIGASGPLAAEGITGNIAYVAVLVDPTIDDIQKLEGWAAAPAQFNLQANLPAGHPYKSAAPIVGYNIAASLTNEAVLGVAGSFRYSLVASMANQTSLGAPRGSLYRPLAASLTNQTSLTLAPLLRAAIKATLANQTSLSAAMSAPGVVARSIAANLMPQVSLGTINTIQKTALAAGLTASAALAPWAAISKIIRSSLTAHLDLVEQFDRTGLLCRTSIGTSLSAEAKVLTSWTGGAFVTPDDSVKRLGRKATWNVHGVDTDVEVTDFGNFFQLHLTGQAEPEEFYINDAWPQYSYITPDDSWKRLVTIAPQSVAPYRIAVGPSLQAVEAQPELVKIPGVVGYDMFIGSNLFPHDGAGVYMAPSQTLSPRVVDENLPKFPSFLLPSTSDYRIFNRYAVFDPDDLPTGSTQGTMFCGYGFFDFPPFTAEVDVFMAGKRSQVEFAIDDFMMPNGRYLIPQDPAPLAYVAGAIEAARGLTQKTLLQPKPTPLFVAGKPFIVGNDHFVIGQSQLAV